MDFDLLFRPLEEVDAWMTGLFGGAPLLVALGIAFVLGLRHASDPDHLVAVTSLVASRPRRRPRGGEARRVVGRGPCGDAGAIGLPLIVLKSELPAGSSRARRRPSAW